MDQREHAWSLEALIAETRATAVQTAQVTNELRQDFRRMDDRLFRMLLIQLATLATVLGAIVASLVF